MKQLYFLESSPFGSASLASQMVIEAINALTVTEQNLQVIHQVLQQASLPALSADYARNIVKSGTVDDPIFAVSEQLIEDLEHSDGLIISTPMHNSFVPASLKLWIDYVVRIGRSFGTEQNKKYGLLADRPVLILVRSGGPCQGDNLGQADFLTPYLSYILGVIGIKNVQFIYLSGAVPADDVLIAARHALSTFLRS